MWMLLEFISIFFVISGFFSAAWIRMDLIHHEQSMKIMNPVWTLTGLWASVVGLYVYLKIGRKENKRQVNGVKTYPKGTLLTLYSGAVCTLANIIGEWFTYLFPVKSYGTLLDSQWIANYTVTLILAIGFQYAVIQNTGKFAPFKAALKALKIDILSLTAWQVGVYAFTVFYISVLNSGVIPSKVDFEFWFMMQLAMFCGFLTSYLINILLIKLGVKKTM